MKIGLYDVLLGVDRAAKDTGERLNVRCHATSAFEAAMTAERIADQRVAEPEVMYTHAMRVKPVVTKRPATAMALALAA